MPPNIYSVTLASAVSSFKYQFDEINQLPIPNFVAHTIFENKEVVRCIRSAQYSRPGGGYLIGGCQSCGTGATSNPPRFERDSCACIRSSLLAYYPFKEDNRQVVNGSIFPDGDADMETIRDEKSRVTGQWFFGGSDHNEGAYTANRVGFQDLN